MVSGLCKLGTYIGTMSRDEAHMIAALLDDPTVGHTALARVLNSEGYEVSEKLIRRHRLMECACK